MNKLKFSLTYAKPKKMLRYIESLEWLRPLEYTVNDQGEFEFTFYCALDAYRFGYGWALYQ